MPISVIDTIKPITKGKYPIVMAEDVGIDENTRLSDILIDFTESGKTNTYVYKTIEKSSPVFYAGNHKIKEDENTFLSIGLTRTSDFVTLHVHANLEMITNSNKVRLKIPEGYRPKTPIAFNLFKLEENFVTPIPVLKIEPDGDIFIYNPPVELEDGAELYERIGDVCYVAADSFPETEE